MVESHRHKTAVKNLSNKIGDKDILNRKTVSNPKYASVKSTIGGKNGTSMKSVSQVSDQLLAKRKGEGFKRIKCSTLARLLHESNAGESESIYDLNRLGNGPDNMDSVSVVAGRTG